jgi:K+ transporter
MTVMTVTTCMLALVMLVTWNTHPLLVLLFLAVYLPLEGAFLSATLVKVSSGGRRMAACVAGAIASADTVCYSCVVVSWEHPAACHHYLSCIWTICH